MLVFEVEYVSKIKHLHIYIYRNGRIEMERPTVFILDVDGVMTTGQFLYSSQGKVMKVFGPDDNDALSMLSDFLEVRFVTGDRKGFEISQARIERDMGFKLDLVSTVKRLEWIKERYELCHVIYIFIHAKL